MYIVLTQDIPLFVCFSPPQRDLVHDIVADRGVLLTSYSTVVIHQDLLLQHDWHYLVLDEGHKIRNPDAQATIAVKQVEYKNEMSMLWNSNKTKSIIFTL